MTKYKVLAHLPFIIDGTSYYRGYGPYSKLRNVELSIAPKGWLDWTHLNDIDVCFFQRPATPFEVHNIETCKKYNRKIVIDFDDNGFIVHESNPASEEYSKDSVQAAMREAMRLADVVTVSTDYLKECLLEQVPTANIVVIPNAVDDSLFSFEPSYLPREKTILMRGAASHLLDWMAYKDGIIQILEENPEYTLSIMGFHPPEFVKDIPRGKYYQFTDIPTYFSTLMELRPEIMIVPLTDDKFNRCKSAIALYEGVMAGAAVVASRLPEFTYYGAGTFSSNQELRDVVTDIIKDQEIREFYYESQINAVPRLSDTNELRLDIIENLAKSRKKYTPRPSTHIQATDQEFHEYALSHGHTQEDHQYAKAHSQAAEWLVTNLRPKTALELGSGTGQTLVELLKRGVMAYGFELNDKNLEYFYERYPMYKSQVFKADLTTEAIDIDDRGDLVMSIEVFEHINKPDEWWVEYLTDLSKKFRHFYFSSTPYSDTPTFDSFWGHVGVRRAKEWIALFEQGGWKFEKNPKLLTSWDLLFSSTN